MKNVYFIFLALLFSVPLRLSAQNAPATAQADTLNKKAWDLRRNDPYRSVEIAKQALALSEKSGYRQGQAFAHKNLGTVYLNQGRYKNSEQHLEKALLLFRQLNNQEQTGNIYNLFGLGYAERGEYQKAITMYYKGLAIFRTINDRDGEAVIFCNLGIVYYGLGNYNKAFELYYSALRLYESLHNQIAVSNLYNNIGLIYSEQKQYRKARSYYHRSLRIDQGMNNLKGLITSYNNMGSSYAYEHLTDSSMYYHLKVLELALKTGDHHALTHAQNNMGELYIDKKQYALADSCLRLAYTGKKEVNDQLGLTIVSFNLGNLNFLQQRYDSAVIYYRNCFDMASKMGSLKYMKEASQGLYEVYEKTGDEKKAFEAFRQFQLYKDSLFNETTSNRIFSIETVYQTEKEEREKELLRKQNIIERNRKLSYAMGGAFVLLLALILLSRQRMKTRQEKLLRQSEKEKYLLEQQNLQLEIQHREQELSRNRQELMAYTQSLLEKNQLLEALREQLDGMDLSGKQEEDKQRLEKIQELTLSRIVTDDDWQEFKKLFEKVFPGFFLRLKEKYPGITTAEMRLAALIRLNLSGREIATMTGVSADSVKKTRQRIRKKMELQQEDDLEKLIHSL